MHLAPRELDKLTLHYAGTVAEGRLEKGLKQSLESQNGFLIAYFDPI